MRDESLQWAMMVFTAIDENNDQIISENELRKAHAIMTTYGNGIADLAHPGRKEIIDQDHNGEIDKDEWLAYMAAVEQTIGTRDFIRSCKLCVQSRTYDPGGVCWYRQTLDGSFSAVSRPIFASKY